MIYILNYNKHSAEKVRVEIDKLNYDTKVGLSEIEALKADVIILPNCKKPQKIIKKLHLLNLFSALRLFNKKIIGIGNGTSIMCRQINEQSACGFFNYFVIQTDEEIQYCIPETKDIIATNYFQSGNYFGITDLGSISKDNLERLKSFLEN